MKFFSKKTIILLLLIIGPVLFTYYYHYKSNISDNLNSNPILVSKGHITIHILSTGIVRPKNRLEIKPPIPGRIEKVLVSEGDLVSKGSILAWMSSNERAALIDAARAKGIKEVEQWEKFYKATPIISPINGAIILRNVEAGQTFTNQDAIFALSDTLSIKANVDETDLGLIKLGQIANISLDAYPGQTFQGEVDHIAYEAKTVNNVTTYEVNITPLHTPDYIRSGMTANVIFLVENKKNILIIPTSSIQFKNSKPTVKIFDLNTETQEVRMIKIGISDGKNTEVTEGLNEGETILIPGVDGIGTKGKNPFGFGRKRKK